ncbi:hypothetical protein VCHE16_3656, partial [Vibrio paracholerae HE-16]
MLNHLPYKVRVQAQSVT